MAEPTRDDNLWASIYPPLQSLDPLVLSRLLQNVLPSSHPINDPYTLAILLTPPDMEERNITFPPTIAWPTPLPGSIPSPSQQRVWLTYLSGIVDDLSFLKEVEQMKCRLRQLFPFSPRHVKEALQSALFMECLCEAIDQEAFRLHMGFGVHRGLRQNLRAHLETIQREIAAGGSEISSNDL